MMISTFVTGPFAENSYLVVDEHAGVAALVDPGDDATELIAAIEDAHVSLRAIWLTHAHLDHIGAIAGIKARWNVPVFLHPADLDLYRLGDESAVQYGVPFEQPDDPDMTLQEGDRLELGALRFEVMHTPGHSPGHVVIHGHGVAFVGDCLFAGSVGRTDLPFADPEALARSLVRIAALPAATRVLSGHGPETTIGEERSSNPFLTQLVRR